MSYEKRCLQCNNNFITKYKRSKFCSRNCYFNWSKIAENNPMFGKKGKSWNRGNRCNIFNCSICHKEVRSSDPRQKFCSKSCSNIGKNTNKGIKRPEISGKNNYFYGKHLIPKHKGMGKKWIKYCINCGKEMNMNCHNKNKILCSASCVMTYKWKTGVFTEDSKRRMGINGGKVRLGKLRVERVTKICPTCNKQFSHVPNYARQVECCSFRCAGIKRYREHKLKYKIARSKLVFPFKDTSIEVKIQNFLSQLHIEYFAHKYISEITHAYQCDILIPSTRTIIECDGDYWHGNPIKFPKPSDKQKQQIEKDMFRTEELKEKGYRVIRLWEREIIPMTLEDFNQIII